MGQHNKRVPSKPNWFRKFIKTPKAAVLLVLLILMSIAAVNPSDQAGLKTVWVAGLTGFFFDGLVSLIRKHGRWFSDGGVITGLIIGLVLSSATPLYVTVLTTVIALLSKHVFKIGRKPIFNPAAFGLLVAVYVFSTGQSWWGDLADMPMWCIVFLLAVGYWIVSKVNKFPQVFSFLGGYFALVTVAGFLHLGQAAYSPGDALRNPLLNSALFMAFFMLTDPPTSPGNYKHQIGFGLIAAVIGTGVYLLFGGLSYLLIGLLVANAWKAFIQRKSAPVKAKLKTVQQTRFSS